MAALDRRLDRNAAAPITIAFSGGGDSLALLHLAMVWAREAGRPLLALTVDHGFHPDSARWTAEACLKAKALGADCRPLLWDGPKPATGLPAAARQARHALLAGAARDAGARVILMGHTADDIAEGDIMRAVDAPGLGRLREWAPSPVWPEGKGIFLLRPLLNARRAALRDFLVDVDETWLDDPANEDLRHPRIRARQTLKNAAGPLEGDHEPRPPHSTNLVRSLNVQEDGAIIGAREAFLASKPTEALPVLSAALLCVSGSSRPPRGEAVRRLLELILADGFGVATLCGCRIEIGADRIVIARARPRRGQIAAPLEPVDWIAARLAAACGLVQTEADAGAPPLLTR